MNIPCKRLFSDDAGSALIETALICPVFTLMLAGVLNFGFLLAQNMQVVNAARAGAEYAQTAGNHTNVTMMQNVAKAAAGSVPNFQVTARSYCTCPPATGVVSCSSVCTGYGQPALYAQVSSSATLSLILGGPASFPVSASATVRVSCPNC